MTNSRTFESSDHLIDILFNISQSWTSFSPSAGERSFKNLIGLVAGGFSFFFSSAPHLLFWLYVAFSWQQQTATKGLLDHNRNSGLSHICQYRDGESTNDLVDPMWHSTFELRHYTLSFIAGSCNKNLTASRSDWHNSDVAFSYVLLRMVHGFCVWQAPVALLVCSQSSPFVHLQLCKNWKI